VIDAWSGPPPTPQQFPANEPNGIRKLLDKIKALELQIRESTSNLLGTAGIRLTQLGMFIDSSLTVGGSLDVTGPMVVGGTADFSGDTSIGGNAAITGTLSLPAGIIDNAALTSPVVPQKIFFYTQGFALSTTAGTFASQAVTVPAGMTSAVVAVTSRLYGLNSTGVNSSLACVSKVAGSGGFNLECSAVIPGDVGTSISPYSTVLSGLTPGGTFLLEVNGNSNGAGWAAWVGNTAEMSGSISWFR
jgi:hypothetical protein